MSVPALEVRQLTVGYGQRTVVRDISFSLEAGTVTTLIGPNGSGKSTLLRATSGLSKPRSGSVVLSGSPVSAMSPRAVAQAMATLPQSPIAPEGLTVADLVARGRQPHQPWYRQWSPEDDAAIDAAMERMDVSALAQTPLEELSGGQRQRAWIALCLAQQTPVVVLDEPTTHLDIAHAVSILETVSTLAHRDGHTILMVLHDISLAARYSDRLLVLHDSALRADGAPRDVIDEALLRECFDIDARVFPDPVDGVPTIAPRSTVAPQTAAPKGVL